LEKQSSFDVRTLGDAWAHFQPASRSSPASATKRAGRHDSELVQFGLGRAPVGFKHRTTCAQFQRLAQAATSRYQFARAGAGTPIQPSGELEMLYDVMLSGVAKLVGSSAPTRRRDHAF
jgi:hypothetical protein